MMSSALAIFLVSLLAFPMTYVTNEAQSLHGELGLFVTGVGCLSLICYLVYLALAAAPRTQDGKDGRGGGTHDWLLYVFTLGAFASVVDLIIGLETDGLVKGFMSVYLRNGEPYLGTPYGALISYWDGTVHYAMYLYMLAAMTYNWTYRRVGLYWAGSIGHSMLILVPGAILGQYGVRWSFLLNVPYIFIPFISAARFLRDGQTETKKKPSTQTHRPTPIVDESLVVTDCSSIWRRPVDLTLCLSLVTAVAICLLRGFAVLGCRHEITTSYLNFYEPYLKDPVVFPKIQMLVYLFYFVPFYIAAIYALLHRGCAWLPDWSILIAGASAQAQIPHILGSLHSRTSPDFQVPGHESARVVFWTVNIFLLIVPHLLALRCFTFPRRFHLQSPSSTGSTTLDAPNAKQKSN